MQLRRDRLNSWLNEHHFSVPPIEFDLGASTGPVWTYGDLFPNDGLAELQRLLALDVYYLDSAGSMELREALAEHSGVAPDRVIVTNGGAEALWILFFVAAEPGANVVVPQRPSFPLFNEAPDSLGLEKRTYSMRRDDGFRIDVDEIAGLIDSNTKLVVVNRPHNPTGAVVSKSQLEQLHGAVIARGATLVVDEVLHPIYHGDHDALSASRLPGATVVGDFSKALSLSGLRIGWLVAGDSRRAAVYEQVRSHFSVSGSPLSEAIGVAALRRKEDIFARARTVARANLACLDAFMHARQDVFGFVRPEGGFTAFPWLRSGESSLEFCREAAAHGVLLAPGDCFDAPEHFRVGIGASERFAEALERLGPVADGCFPIG